MTEIWHNPRCSKSRQTLALIEDKQPVVRNYLEDSPTAHEIRAALSALGLQPIEMMRRGEAIFKELGLSLETSDDLLIRAMVEHPKLIERPIVFHREKARIGRPPEAVLALF